VQRIWVAHDLQPHRIRTFKHATDPTPFTWTKTADQILAKLTPLNASVH
jgi:hypothetical protein